MFSPLLALLVAGILTLTHGNTEWLLLALPSGRRLGILWRSLAMSAGVAVIDVSLGVLIACAGWGWSRRFVWLRWLPLVFIALPPYIHALAWNDVVQQLSFRLGTLRPAGVLLSVWVMAMHCCRWALVWHSSVWRQWHDRLLTRHAHPGKTRPSFGGWCCRPPRCCGGRRPDFPAQPAGLQRAIPVWVNVYALKFLPNSVPATSLCGVALVFPLLLIVFGLLFAGQTFLRRVAQLRCGASRHGAPSALARRVQFLSKGGAGGLGCKD